MSTIDPFFWKNGGKNDSLTLFSLSLSLSLSLCYKVCTKTILSLVYFFLLYPACPSLSSPSSLLHFSRTLILTPNLFLPSPRPRERGGRGGRGVDPVLSTVPFVFTASIRGKEITWSFGQQFRSTDAHRFIIFYIWRARK